MKQRIFTLLLSTFMVVTSFSTATFAKENEKPIKNTKEQQLQNQKEEEKKQKIEAMLNELGEYRTTKELNLSKMSSEKRESLLFTLQDNRENELETQLFNLGVTEVEQPELNRLNQISDNDNSTTPFVSTPSSTSSVKWYSYRYTYTYNNVSYNIQELYAQGLNGNSNLADGRNGVTLYTNKQIAVRNLKEIGSIYAQKVVGLIPVVQWTPYELLFSNNSGVTNNSHVVTYRSLSTVCFSYVRRSNQSDSYQELSFISNKVSVSSSHTLAGYNNEKPYTKTTDKSQTIYASTYAPLLAAVKSRIDVTAPSRSYVSYYRFYNYNKTASITEYISNPSFPAQVR